MELDESIHKDTLLDPTYDTGFMFLFGREDVSEEMLIKKYLNSSKRDVFKRLAEIEKVSSLTPDQLRSYEADIKNARDYHNELEGARMEGRQEGAWKKLCGIVANMRAMGMDTATIGSLTNESPDVVASI